jgi:hypothetical protein
MNMLMKMDSFLKVDPQNEELKKWMLRLYARQTFASLYCARNNAPLKGNDHLCFDHLMLSFAIDEYVPINEDLVKKVGDSWIPAPPTIASTPDYWSLIQKPVHFLHDLWHIIYLLQNQIGWKWVKQ